MGDRRLRRWGLSRYLYRLRDLTLLEASVARITRRTERLRFFRAYLGVRRLGPAGKRLWQALARYSRRRWGTAGA